MLSGSYSLDGVLSSTVIHCHPGDRQDVHVADAMSGAAFDVGRHRHPRTISADAVIQQLPGRGLAPAVSVSRCDVPRLHGEREPEGEHPRAGHQHHSLAVHVHEAVVQR